MYEEEVACRCSLPWWLLVVVLCNTASEKLSFVIILNLRDKAMLC